MDNGYMENNEKSLKMKVYNGFIDLISTGQLSAGEIVSERMLIERFECSKSPVREALVELCKDGILVSIPRCGYQIVHFSIKALHEITQMRLLLELSNFRQIAPLITNSVIDFTILPLEQLRLRGASSVWEANEKNTQFHMALAKLSGNDLLCQYLKKTLDMYSRAYAQMYVTVPRIIEPTKDIPHSNIINAWKARDYKSAEEYLREDIILAERELEEATRQ